MNSEQCFYQMLEKNAKELYHTIIDSSQAVHNIKLDFDALAIRYVATEVFIFFLFLLDYQRVNAFFS
jgi:hypothetical protein